jgi:hypothetical protein
MGGRGEEGSELDWLFALDDEETMMEVMHERWS